MKKEEPGSFGYYNNRRKIRILKTILLFLAALALFLAGYIATKTRNNLLTVAAILAVLPACNSLVQMIMYLKYNGCNETLHKELCSETERDGLTHSYGMVFTTQESGTFEIPSIAVRNNAVCGLCQTKKAKPALLEKHIGLILNQNGYSNVTVKIFDSTDAYKQRLKKMNETNAEDLERERQIMHLLHNISL